MSELVVILRDLFSPPAEDRPAGSRVTGGAQAGGRALPRLPSLEVLLARARRERLSNDWRSWLARRIGGPLLAPAALVARAWSVQTASGAQAASGTLGYWLATPVHLLAGIDRVLLHPAGLLCLSVAEQQALVEQFAREFADSPWHLRAGGQRELLLVGPVLSASAADPARFLGADPLAGLPRGPDAGALRRLGSELELWLHEHPLNRERASRGELPITTLWLWGGGGAAGPPAAPARSASSTPVTPATPGMAPHLFGSDTYAEALVRLLGGESQSLEAATGPQIEPSTGAGSADRVVVYSLHANGTDAVERLELLERQWLAPALLALRAGRLRALLLVAGDYVYHLGRFGPWRIWRACTPWWEVLG